MRLLCAFDRLLFKLVSVIAQLLLVAAAAAAFYQVIARFVLHAPADWSEVLTRALLIWTVLLGVALAFRHGAMISVELLRNLLGGARRRALEALIGLICAGFLGFVAWIGGQMTWRVRFQNVPSLDISISWIYLAIPVGATLAAIAVLAAGAPAKKPRPLAQRRAGLTRSQRIQADHAMSQLMIVSMLIFFGLSVPVAVSIGLASLAGSAPPTCPGWWWPSSYTPRWTSTRWWRFPSSSWPAT